MYLLSAKKIKLFFVSIFLCVSSIFSQSVSGIITDASTHELLAGVNIISETHVSASTDINGKYILQLSPGDHVLTYSFIGYETVQIETKIISNKNIETNIELKIENTLLNTVVVSGSLYEKKITEETVSIDVIKSDLIKNTNATSLSDAITKAPGVYMMDEQANIRGGTGFTYGAGSRVMLVVDDQLLLAADRGDAKWNFVPLENVDQIEIIKGASSVLYGSSALNGVISVRTAWPGSKPYTNITVYQGIYDNPKLKEAAWWNFNPLTTGISFCHRQKFTNYDLVLGGHVSRNDSYLEGQHSYRGRLNWKTRFHLKNTDHITYGLNGNAMLDDEGIYFLWQNPDAGAYLPFGGNMDSSTSTLLNWKYKWVSIDPWLNWFDNHSNEHHFKMRFYNNNVQYSDTTGGNGYLLNTDYQFHRSFNNNLFITAGATGYYFNVNDDQLLNHTGFSGGGYLQIDKKIFSRFTVNVGVREELYQLDSASATGVPIFKAGLNYKVNQTTFMRASYGQGYRFPSLVEKYASTSLGALNIFPNPDLKAEYGYNAEIGIKKQVSIDAWQGFADIALYMTDYYNMTEFTFDFYSGEGLGFKSLNTSRARIGGIEFTLQGEGNIFGHHASLSGGYNYVYPADIAEDSSNLNFSTFTRNFFKGFTTHPIDSAFLGSVLKYRFRHMIRLDAQYDVNRFSFGTDINYYSLMENLDAIYIQYIPGIIEYRDNHLNGDWIFDVRVGYALTPNSKIQLLVKNVFNRMYALRPAKYDAPRNFTVQYKIDF